MDDHATSTNKGIWEAQNTNGSVSGQKPGESSSSYETRLGAFNNQRAADAQKKAQ
jgi:hypothetical protein